MRSRGFTLVEMLVTLVLVGMVSTLLWQALGQVARIETQLADSRVLGEGEALQRAWVQRALAGVATGPLGDSQRFEGRPERLQSTTTMPPWPQAGGLERMVLLLQPDRAGDNTTLLAQHGQAEAVVLWQWPGKGRFEYMGADQQWQPQWPPATGPAPALPLAVRLVGPPAGALWVPVLATQNPIVGRLAVEQSDSLP